MHSPVHSVEKGAFDCHRIAPSLSKLSWWCPTLTPEWPPECNRSVQTYSPIRPEGGPKLCPKSVSGGGGLLFSRRFCHPARTIRILQLHGHLKVQGAELTKKVHVWKLVFIMKQLMVRIVFSYQIYQFWKLYGTDGIGKDARDHTYPSGTTPRCHV